MPFGKSRPKYMLNESVLNDRIVNWAKHLRMLKVDEFMVDLGVLLRAEVLVESNLDRIRHEAKVRSESCQF